MDSATAAPNARRSGATADVESVDVESTAAGRQAAAMATSKNELRLTIPGVGDLRGPSLDQLAFLAGIATLAIFELIEWPVAVVLGVGHVLARNRHHALLRDFGEALDKA